MSVAPSSLGSAVSYLTQSCFKDERSVCCQAPSAHFSNYASSMIDDSDMFPMEEVRVKPALTSSLPPTLSREGRGSSERLND